MLHYIGWTRERWRWNSCIRAALCRRDQGDEGGGTAVYVLHYIGGTRVMRVVEQQYTCCII